MQRRNTIQRELVLRAVTELGNHASAEEVCDRFRRDAPSLSRATVYRNLNILAEEDRILRIEVPGAADRYDHNTDAHYHARCLRCGSVFDVEADGIPDMLSRVRDAHGFVLFGCDVVFKGICPECNSKEGKEKEKNENGRNL